MAALRGLSEGWHVGDLGDLRSMFDDYEIMGFYDGLMGFYDGLMGFYDGLMGFYDGLMGFHSGLMGFIVI